MNVREDFPILKNNIIYFDSCATTLKPNSVIEEISNYYRNYSANAHRGDYDISLKVDNKINEVREKVKNFINAKSTNEIIFTSGATESLNIVVKGLFEDYLNDGDEVLTSKAEHASLILPWFDLKKHKDIKINYIDLNEDLSLSVNKVKEAITDKTKVITLSHVTNVLGDVRDIKEICSLAHEKGILVLIDGAQSVPHMKTDVQDLDVDFMCFSAHKMLGPTGTGVLYGKEGLLNKINPVILGGGMNDFFDSLGNVEYKALPEKLEAGTPNIAGIIGLGSAIDYINKIGINNVHEYEVNLKKYMLDKLSNLKNITVYNKDFENGIVTFNVEGIFAQDVAAYLNKKNICVRVGTHCAKILSEVLGVKNTIRASFYVYNTKEEIDKLIEALDNDNILFESL